jgi:3-oxoacyl-[acyl-carrier-protein] synthase-3
MSLKYGYMSILAGESQNAVATGSENVSSLLRSDTFYNEIEARVMQLEEQPEIAFEKDFLRWMLSDGAGAVWMSKTPNPSGLSLQIDWIWQNSYANELDVCMYAGAEKLANGSLKGWREYLPKAWLDGSLLTIKQDVKLLNEKIVEYTVTKSLKRLLAMGKFTAADINWFLPHYSSDFFRERVAEGLKEADCPIPQEKWFTNLSSKGNTGSASIYIILEELFNSGRLRPGEKLLCFIPESGRFSTAFMQLTVV